MSPDIHTKSQSDLKAESFVRESTPAGIIEQLSKQIRICDEASTRIKEEGIVVRDMKGSVIQHPAIKIEIDSGKIIREILQKFFI